MRVLLFHGKDTDPSQKWYPWIVSELKKRGIEVYAPNLPNPNDPNLKDWLVEIDKLVPNEETIMVGHSRGGMAVLRWLERQKPNKKVKKVILVATNSGLTKDRPTRFENNRGFYKKNGYNFSEIKKHCDSFVVMHSKDDHIVPYQGGVDNANGLSAELISFDNYRHFGNTESGMTKKFPVLLEEILKS